MKNNRLLVSIGAVLLFLFYPVHAIRNAYRYQAKGNISYAFQSWIYGVLGIICLCLILASASNWLLRGFQIGEIVELIGGIIGYVSFGLLQFHLGCKPEPKDLGRFEDMPYVA